MRRRSRALAILGLGTFLIVLGPLLRWYVLPRVQVAPYDLDTTSVLTGPGRYLDPATGRPATGTMTLTEHVLGNAQAGPASHRAVWDVAARLDTPQTLHNPDARQAFQLKVERWVFDRHTNRSVSCCGATVRAGSDAYTKFPFNAGARYYQLWDQVADRAFPAGYTGTARLYGHTYNQYTSVVPPTFIGTRQVPPAVVGAKSKDSQITVEEWYEGKGTVELVDPLTGTPVSIATHQVVTLRLPGNTSDAATAFDVSLHTTPATERSLADFAAKQGAGLAVLQGPAPFALLGLGIVAVLAGTYLTARKPRRRVRHGRTSEHAPPAEALEATP